MVTREPDRQSQPDRQAGESATQDYLNKMREAYADLDSWKARVSRGVELPQKGSQLALDNAVYDKHPISEFARTSLASSGDHLRFVRVVIEAREFHPMAAFTCVRGALVAAAQAVWVLSPDSAEDRQQRGLKGIAEMYAQMDAAYKEQETFHLDPQERASLAQQQAWLKARIDLVASLRSDKERFRVTSIVHAAIDYTFMDRERREHGRLLWRQLSGDAHALGWPSFQRASFTKVDWRTGIGHAAAVGKLSDIAQPWVCSYLLLKRGWSLFDRRCEA